jgi:hypothetical protein
MEYYFLMNAALQTEILLGNVVRFTKSNRGGAQPLISLVISRRPFLEREIRFTADRANFLRPQR